MGSLDFDAMELEEDAEVCLTVVGLLIDIAAKRVATSLAVLTGRRLAVAGTTEPLSWTGMRERAARDCMAAVARLTENDDEMSCGIVMFVECERSGSVSGLWRRKRERGMFWEENNEFIPSNQRP